MTLLERSRRRFARALGRGAPPAAAQAQDAEFHRRVAAADALRDAGERLAAADAYDEALTLRADDAGIWVQLGNMSKDAGDSGRAQAAYGVALGLRPDDADTHLQLARAIAGGGDPDRARASYDRALELEPALAAAGEERAGLPAQPGPLDGVIVIEREPPQAAGPGRERLVGAIEHVDEAGVRGWIVDPADLARVLLVRCRVNGATLAVAPAADFRRELQDRYGGTGRHGFAIRFAGSPELAGLSEAVLDVEEAQGGHRLLDGRRLRFDQGPLLKAQEEARGALDRHLDEIRRTLDALAHDEARRPRPVEAYARLIGSAPIPPAPRAVSASVELDVVVVQAGADAATLAAVAAGLCGQELRCREVHLAAGSDVDPEPLRARLRDGGLVVNVHRGDAAGATPLARAAAAVTGAWTLVTTDGDVLHPQAAGWLLAAASGAGALAYADGDVALRTAEGTLVAPRFRTPMDEDLLLASDAYAAPLCGPAALMAGAAQQVQGADPSTALALAHLARAGRHGFRHVPLVLSRRWETPGGARRAGADRSAAAARFLDVSAPGARLDTVAPPSEGLGRVTWPPGSATLSAIVLTRDGAGRVDLLAETIAERLAQPDAFEMVVVSNGSRDPATGPALRRLAERHAWLRVAERDDAFSWSRFNVEAARHARGDLLVFLNDDMLCLTPGWDDRLRGQLGRTGIGAVGGRLLYPDGTLQHAGVVLRGPADAAHEAAGDPPSAGLAGRTRLAHDAAAVTGAFLGVRREVFEEVGGFAEDFPLTYNDIEFCERLWSAGLRVLYDPAQTWTHYESVSRGFDSNDPERSARHDAAVARLAARPGRREVVDQAYNPHFDRSARPFAALRWPQAADALSWLDAQARRAAQARAAGRL